MTVPLLPEPEELETFDADGNPKSAIQNLKSEDAPANAESYLDQMIRLLRGDGVRFPDNKVQKFIRLERLTGSLLHAEGAWTVDDGNEQRVAVVFGPQYGPVTAKMVEDCLRQANRLGYDALVFAGFAFDGAAQAVIQDDSNPHVRVHLAHIRPDVNMGDLLKNTPGSQLFTVSGTPRTRPEVEIDGKWVPAQISPNPFSDDRQVEPGNPHQSQFSYRIIMEGVDIYDPVGNTTHAVGADKVAAWFLDTDYDGQTFCITQAFFPDKKAWEKLARAMSRVIDEDRFAAFTGTVSLPFPAGKHRRVAVKVIDPRGNELMRVHHLAEEVSYV